MCARKRCLGHFLNPLSEAASGSLPRDIRFVSCLVFAQAKVLSFLFGFSFNFGGRFVHLGEAAFGGFELPLVKSHRCLLVKPAQAVGCPLQRERCGCVEGAYGGVTSPSPSPPAKTWPPPAGHVL